MTFKIYPQHGHSISILRPNYNCYSYVNNSRMSAQDENDNSRCNGGEKTVKNIDWKCRYCSYTNNEEISWSVFGDYFVDYDDGREGARMCIICYKYCARRREDTRGYETRG